MGSEERIVDPVTGGEKGRKAERFDLIPIGPLTELARLYGAGAAKYEDRNWERGFAWSLSYAALMRHATQFWDGESVDAETQRHHLASVIFHAMALMEFEAKGKGTDDRPVTIDPIGAAIGRLMPSAFQKAYDTLWPARMGTPPDPLGHDQPSPFDVAPATEEEIAADPVIQHSRHTHLFGDHDADQPERDHKGCVPCPEPGCNCHHSY